MRRHLLGNTRGPLRIWVDPRSCPGPSDTWHVGLWKPLGLPTLSFLWGTLEPSSFLDQPTFIGPEKEVGMERGRGESSWVEPRVRWNWVQA